MMRGENIPIDLVIQILLRLPVKSIAKFRCVSKLWDAMLISPYFTDLFHTRSLSRPPRLLFSVQESDGLSFLTSPHPHNPDDLPSSLTVEFLMKLPKLDKCPQFRGHASSFIHFQIHGDIVLCNPSTGQHVSLPLPEVGRMGRTSFLGFDPIDKQFNVLSITRDQRVSYQIVTLDVENNSWRKIHCPLKHYPCGEGICINGILCYLAYDEDQDSVIVCFDVRSEKFKFIPRDFDTSSGATKLINYKGRLGVITGTYFNNDRLYLCLWIKDVENPESGWFKHFSISLWDDVYCIVGVTSTGEIVLSTNLVDASKPFCVIYIDTETSTVQSVEIQGLRPNYGSVYVDVLGDYVEDLNFITMMKTRKTSTSPLEVKAKARVQQEHCMFDSINNFDSLRL